jgi:hypothetical protein
VNPADQLSGESTATARSHGRRHDPEKVSADSCG